MMAYNERSLDDYVDVAQRIADFRALYPDGSLQPADPAMPYHVVRVPALWCVQCIGRRQVKAGQSWKACPRCQGTGTREDGEPTEDIFVVYAAAAYRTPGDARPGVGMAWEPYPGRTPYTAASELMNAETSAWGRAIQAVLASDAKKGVASREEVRNRRAERDDGLPVNKDGSLSRSQTTDEEKERAGVMTAAQQAEHTALGGGHPGERKTPKAERDKVRREVAANWPHTPPRVVGPEVDPDGDPWLDQPAGHLDGAEGKPGTIDPADQRAILTALAKLGVRDHGERVKRLSAITGRKIASTNDLSWQEGRKARDHLKAAKV